MNLQMIRKKEEGESAIPSGADESEMLLRFFFFFLFGFFLKYSGFSPSWEKWRKSR